MAYRHKRERFPTGENLEELKARLKRQGLRNEGNAYRREREKHWRSLGVALASEARWRAWRDTSLRFPPEGFRRGLPTAFERPLESRGFIGGQPAKSGGSDGKVERVEGEGERGGLDLRGVQFVGGESGMSHQSKLSWVEEALGELARGVEVGRLKVPGPSCLGWLEWAYKRPDKFRSLLTRQVSEERDAEEGRILKVCKMQAAEITKMLEEAEAHVDREMALGGGDFDGD